MTKEDLLVETNILIGLMKATIEQSSTLIGELKQKPKQEFNTWMKLSWKMLNEFEKNNLVNEDYLTKLSDIYHNINLEIKKTLKESLINK